MGAVTAKQLLAPLFEILRLVWKTDDRPTLRISSGRGLHDVTNPVMAAIYAIGGEAAITGYDELLALGGDFRWLRDQRAAIAMALLEERGLDAAPAAAADADVPVL